MSPLTKKLLTLKAGEYMFLETSLEKYPGLMREITKPDSRRHTLLKDTKFKSKLYTGFGFTAGDIIYLVKVTREK